MHLSQAIKRWIAVIVFIVLALSFYRFRWGILGLVNIGPLPTACENMRALDAYLRTGGDPEAYLGRTPLIMCATEKGSYGIVARLIDLGVDIDARKKRPLLPFMDASIGTTALHVSVRAGNFELTKLLFENGADVNWERNASASPLNLVLAYNRPEFLRLFLEHENGFYELDENRVVGAARDGYMEIFMVLFEEGIHLEGAYELALAGAASQGNTQLVNFLYEQGVSVDAKNNQTGQTALHLPAKLNHVQVVEFLVSVGADINALDEDGNTPLHYAAISNHAEIAQLLIESDADIQLENNEGETPLEAAVSHESWEVVNILQHHEGVSI